MQEVAGEVIKLQEAIERFMEITDGHSEPLTTIFAVLTRNLKIVRDFFELLDHEEALKWMLLNYGSDIRSTLTPIRGYLGGLQQGMLMLSIPWTPEQEACLNQAVESAQYIDNTISKFREDSFNTYRPDIIPFVIKASPQEAFAPIWSIARYTLRSTSLRLSVSSQLNLAPIYYPPDSTTALLELFFQVLGAQNISGVIIADLKGEPGFCALSIGTQDLRMTPQLWEQMRRPFFHRDAIERLREIGGSIEPLTWDEGQGQGVIIRLPWAKET